MSKTIVSIFGSLGVGKTTLDTHLRKVIPEALYVDEPVDKWLEIKDDDGTNLLDVFYKDKKRWSYTFQNVAFITRLNALINALANPNHDIIIMDGSIASDKNIYAQMLRDDGQINKLEWEAYNIWETFYQNNIQKNEIYYVYLKCDPKIIKQRVLKRGRPEELDISIEYLQKLEEYLNRWAKGIDPKHLLVCDFSCDENSEDYEKILKQISDLIKKKN